MAQGRINYAREAICKADQNSQHTAVTSPTLQVSILAFSPVPGALDVVHTQGIILQLLQSRGEVVGYQSPQRSSGLIVYAAFAEYASPADAYSAVAAYNGCLFEVYRLDCKSRSAKLISNVCTGHHSPLVYSPGT